MTQIANCTKGDCKSPFQDRKYGKNRRVHNTKGSGALRCTVCGNERGA